ncbi:MAG: AAA family ATPase [Candidatus Acetothermia bacterium]|jgi:MoxR-like ATPase|nr:AAA family ATPase [Candidatus Acetothermia bacterium]MDH7505301.1 MoxR family ATPase [Candidatus Acetothermia bacterium]
MMIDEQVLQRTQRMFQELREEIGRVIVGHDAVIEGVLICLLCQGHALLEGVPGLGKTLLVRTLARALGLEFSRIQFTPDLMPADITGTLLLMEDEAGRRHFEFARGPLFAHLILADEINRATPKTQSALLEAMQERSVTVGNNTHELEEPFVVLATQNPIEMEGTYPLPEAQVDRFFFKLKLAYPDLGELEEIIVRNTSGAPYSAREVLSREEVLAAREIVAAFPVPEQLYRYASALVHATHPDSELAPPAVREYVEYGASPRGGISLIAGAKAHAFLAGEVNVGLEDIRAVFAPSLNHRVILSFKGEAAGVSPEEVLDEVLRRVEVDALR